MIYLDSLAIYFDLLLTSESGTCGITSGHWVTADWQKHGNIDRFSQILGPTTHKISNWPSVLTRHPWTSGTNEKAYNDRNILEGSLNLWVQSIFEYAGFTTMDQSLVKRIVVLEKQINNKYLKSLTQDLLRFIVLKVKLDGLARSAIWGIFCERHWQMESSRSRDARARIDSLHLFPCTVNFTESGGCCPF